MFKIPGVFGLVVLSVALLLAGLIMGVYSEWFQNALRQKIVERLNADPDVTFRLDGFRLTFPLDINVTDLLLVSHGDTIIAASSIKAGVDIMPIVRGEVELKEAILQDARYQIGAMDSASCMVVSGREIVVDKSTVRLSPLDIDVSRVSLDSARVSMFINPADTFPTSPPSEPSHMNIEVRRIDFKNLEYQMTLMPAIYDLTARMDNGSVDSVSVDLFNQTVDIGDFTATGLDASYLAPDSAQIASTLVITKESLPSAPWTVRIDRINVDRSRALYTTYGLKPQPGLDFGYIEVDPLNLKVRNFYNRASAISMPFELNGTERCGVQLTASGTLGIDSTGMTFRNFSIATPDGTDLYADAYMGTETELTDPSTPLSIDIEGNLAVADLKTMFPAFKPYLAAMRKNAMLYADVDINGTSGDLDIEKLEVKIDRHARLAASGNLTNVFDPKEIGGKLKFNAAINDISHWTNELLAGTGVIVPTMSMKGDVTVEKGYYKGDFSLETAGGHIAADGFFKGTTDDYNLSLTADAFPVDAFMPSLGIGKVTARLTADGHGFDLFKTSTSANVDLSVARIEYQKHAYSDINFTAKVADDHAALVVNSYNPGLDLHVDAFGEIDDSRYVWTVDVESKDLDLGALGLTATPATVSTDLTLKADIDATMRNLDATLILKNAEYTTPEGSIAIDDSKMFLNTTATHTNLSAQNRDLYAFFSTPLPLDSIMRNLDKVASVVDTQFKSRNIDIEEIERTLMPFSFDLEGGGNNALSQLLGESNIAFKRISVMAGNDTSLYVKANVYDFRMNDVKLDTINFDLRQFGQQLDYTASVNNRPGTFDQWAHVDLNGFFKTGEVGVNVRQADIKNKVGFNIGARLELSRDSTITLHIEPYHPIINYRTWDINPDNFISYSVGHKHLDANVNMKSDVSRVAIYTEHVNDTTATLHGSDEDLIVQLFDIQLQDWIALDPFAPPIKGNLSAGLRVNWENNVLNGTGTVDLTDFYYGKDKVGDFNADLAITTDADERIKADVDLWVNGEKTVALSGYLNDKDAESPFNMNLSMINFPLSVANPFLTGTARLGGNLKGNFDIKGTSANPQMNGFLAFEKATVDVIMLGSTLSINGDSIPVHSNNVMFKDFRIMGANENPLLINGTVNLKKPASPEIALNLKADNMQIVNTSRAPKGASIYGKAFMGLSASVRGNLRMLNVDGNVDVLPGTNLTYVLDAGPAALESQQNSDMVKFVNFADTAATIAADSLTMTGMLLNINANLNIQNGVIINVDLGTNAQDRVQLQGSGSFNYTSSIMGDGRLTGRYTFSGGFIRYSPPLISKLNFNFTEGSYVAFSGNIENPQLNIKAVEQMRANVSQAGQNSRLIYFDIILSATGSLNNMNVAFDLETDDDITVANELATMSPTQRASEAMNLLLYNTYTGGSTKATSNLSGNPLFSFLTSSVNSWLANNVRGVDLSIGVDQYDQTTNGLSSTTTSYSYRVSKNLFNDRIKIVVGGSYSDDPNENANVAENLINDISVEYFLNNARTMYLRLFRHTGYESILEGEITQTGVGFVYRKRIGRISDMFTPRRHHKKKDSNDNGKPQDGKDATSVNSDPVTETTKTDEKE